ncbi:hypothetical protein BGC07_13540 [Piscirickettsia litoralis]|uniref:Major facilitator superfamily (MFS) profile domain-containing protein n=1 Tax=Piscirickettsia litoralis TaxID=1891921 RepID=A0ABX3A7X4_9GAMM|nr:hypothetical protein BGC07_13540 [Piscirickettsia litoralis]
MYLAGIIFVFLPNISVNFFVSRALQGLAAGGVMATARGMVNRSYHGKGLVRMLTVTAIAASIASAFSPALGGLLVEYGRWYDIFILLGSYALLLLLGVAFISFPTGQYYTKSSLSWLQRKTHLLTNSAFLRPAVAASLVFSICAAYYTVSSYLFQVRLGVSAQNFGLLSLATSGGFILAAAINGWGLGSEKNRLVLGYLMILVSAVGLLAVTFFTQVTVRELLNLIMLAMFGVGIVYPLAMAIAIRSFKHIAGSAGALMGALQIGSSALMSLLISYFVGPKTLLALALLMLVVTLFSMVIMFNLKIHCQIRYAH